VPKRQKQVCPKCQSKHGVPVIFGMPDVELAARAERGEVALGGCCVEPGINWHCTSCDYEWGSNPGVGRYASEEL
jgi:hypothetical protein